MNFAIIAIIAAVVATGSWILMRGKISNESSPNQNPHTGEWKGIVLHYTAGSGYRSTVSWLKNPAAKSSSHFVIGRNGQIVQLVDLEHESWHAGRTRYKNASNHTTIGIELANHGLLVQKGSALYYRVGGNLIPYDGKSRWATLIIGENTEVSGYWEPYPLNQIGALIWLLSELRTKHGIPLTLYGHEDICQPLGRKTDPGPLFPWHAMPGIRADAQTRSV